MLCQSVIYLLYFLITDFFTRASHSVALCVLKQVAARGLGADMGKWLAECLALPPVPRQVPPLEGLDTRLLRRIGLHGHFHGLSLPEE